MSTLQAIEPEMEQPPCSAIETIVVPRTHDIGGLSVRRVLPAVGRRTVGPFVFLDEMGPATFSIGHGLDVRPHPHIGLATVTYLFEGAIVHRDSLGSLKTITPGAVNWMSAGRGIVHSERTGAEDRTRGARLAGLQLWTALPMTAEESDPFFATHSAEALPVVEADGVRARVITGSLLGVTSPVATPWDTLFVDFDLTAGATTPIDAGAEERALYLVDGMVEIAGEVFEPGRLLVIRQGDTIAVRAVTKARFALVGGATLDAPRHIWWNFVSSSKDRIDAAKADWLAGRFAAVPGETEFIPLPAR